MHAYKNDVVWLQSEVTRLTKLLESQQTENLEFRSQIYNDPVLGPILQLRREIESRKLHEADLLTALEETKEEMAALKATDDALLGAEGA